MPSKNTPNPPEFRSIGTVAAVEAFRVADNVLSKTGKDPLKPHQRRELLAQAGGK